MTPDPDLDLMLLYVAGVADTDEAERAEAMLCAAHPEACAAYAEAVAVFHAMPLVLTCIEPPASCRHTLLGRITADVSSSNSGSSNSIVSRLRWPIYVSSGLAACLAVALTMSVLNARRMANENQQLAASVQTMSQRDAEMSSTLATVRGLMSSSHVSLASLSTTSKETPDVGAYGKVLFCPVTRQYQFTVFNLRPLPPGRAYELWLITPDKKPVAAGTFVVNADGTATVNAHTARVVDVVAQVAITDEPASGSESPTGAIHLVGALAAAN